MYADPHADANSEAALRLLVEARDPAGDLETRQHRSARIVLVGSRVTEYRKKPVALLRADVTLETIHG